MNTRTSFGGRMQVRLAVLMGALLAALVGGVVLAPAAGAAPAEQCFGRTFNGKVSIEKTLQKDGKAPYSATYRWCSKNGKVTKFIVTATTPLPGTTPVYVDIRPYRSNAFGRPTFDIFIDATRGNKTDHHAFSLTAGGAAIGR